MTTRHPDYISVEEAAKLFDLTPDAIRKRLRWPDAPKYRRVGRRIWIDRASLAASDWHLAH